MTKTNTLMSSTAATSCWTIQFNDPAMLVSMKLLELYQQDGHVVFGDTFYERHLG